MELFIQLFNKFMSNFQLNENLIRGYACYLVNSEPIEIRLLCLKSINGLLECVLCHQHYWIMNTNLYLGMSHAHMSKHLQREEQLKS